MVGPRPRSLIVLALFVLSLFVVTNASTETFAFSGGTGAVASPYGVSSCADFMSIDDTTSNLSKAYVLTSNIDCSATSMTPLKNGTTYFTGVFDGAGYSISGISISCTAQDCGLFARLGTNAVVKNFTMVSPSIASTSTVVGGVAGQSGTSNLITNITISGGSVSTSYSSVSKSDPSYVGGVVGIAASGTISNINSSVSVSGKNYTGGIVGNGQTATLNISDVAVNGDVTGESWVGGIIGSYYNAASYGLVITRASIGSISVSGFQDVGGFLGYGWNIKVDSSTSLATVTGRGTSISSSGIGEGAMVGGFAGQLSGGDSTIIDSYIRGDVSATFLDFNARYVGGLVGWGRLTNLYVTRTSYIGTVTGYQQVAGMTGLQSLYSYVTDSYFRANLITSTTTSNGGFVGNTSYTTNLTRSYYAGTQSAVVASRYGIAGTSSSGVTTCTNTFFDAGLLGATTTSQSSGVCTGAGKTTSAMKTQSTYTGFDFTPGTGIWSISSTFNDGYPYLANAGGVPTDSTPPSASWTEPSSPRSTRTMSYTLTFSESVSGISSGDFSNTGTASGCTFTPSASTGSSITVSVTCSSDGTVVLRLATSSVQDSASNAGPISAVDAATVVIDASPPSASWTEPSSPRSTRTMSYTLTFSESVSGIASSDFSISGTASCSAAPSASSGTSISVVVTCSTDGTVILELSRNTVVDAALNTGPIADATASTVTISTPVATTTTSPTSAPSMTPTSSPVTSASTSTVPEATNSNSTPSSSTTLLVTSSTVAGSATNRNLVTTIPSSPNVGVVAAGEDKPTETTSTSTTTIPLNDVELPEMDSDGAGVLLDGRRIAAKVTRENNELVLTAGPISARIWVIQSDGKKVSLSDDGRLKSKAGDSVTVAVEGFASSSDVEVRLYSDPLLLGRSQVDDRGQLSASYSIPEGVENGDHRIVLLGETENEPVTFALAIQIGDDEGGVNFSALILTPLVIAIIAALLIPVAIRRRRRAA